ncbi:hypothetical protein M3J09_001645 [Ascochyta lentis]
MITCSLFSFIAHTFAILFVNTVSFSNEMVAMIILSPKIGTGVRVAMTAVNIILSRISICLGFSALLALWAEVNDFDFRRLRLVLPALLFTLVAATVATNATVNVVFLTSSKNVVIMSRAAKAANYTSLAFWSEVTLLTLLPAIFFVVIKIKSRTRKSTSSFAGMTPRFNLFFFAILLLLAVWAVSSLAVAAYAFQHQQDLGIGEEKAKIVVWTQLVSQVLFALVLVGLCLPGQLAKNSVELLSFLEKLQELRRLQLELEQARFWEHSFWTDGDGWSHFVFCPCWW